MNKKGSMELSVNSIVILVIAIVLMGLILAFVQRNFNKFDIVADEPEPSAPTVGNPITLSKSSISIVQGGKLPIKIGVYNPDAVNPLTDVIPVFTCTNGLVLTTDVLQQTIAPGQSKVFGAILKTNGAADSYACSLCIAPRATPTACVSGLSKEVFVEVR